MKPRILVVGSLVMDLIVTTERFCGAGETVIGKDFATAPGGKGANQAVQAARLGADVTMVGKVGKDDFGKALIRSLRESGGNTDCILSVNGVSTAVGNVQIQKNAQGVENRIIVVPGANFALTKEDVSFLEEKIADYDMVILQHEIPMEVNVAVAAFAHAKNVPVVLNPAPSAAVPEEMIPWVTFLCPNEHEAGDISGIQPVNADSILGSANRLHEMGFRKVLITWGKNGCLLSDGATTTFSPAMENVAVVDPTAAGDSFIGAFCTAIAAGIPEKDALVFANCTAGITVSRMGAQTSLPTFDEVIAVLNRTDCTGGIFRRIKEV